jgi:hypothetical protein
MIYHEALPECLLQITVCVCTLAEHVVAETLCVLGKRKLQESTHFIFSKTTQHCLRYQGLPFTSGPWVTIILGKSANRFFVPLEPTLAIVSHLVALKQTKLPW